MANIVIVDADALIALAMKDDPHHQKAVNINKKLIDQGVEVIFPVTVFPEALTTLKRAFNQPKKAHLINKQLQAGAFQIEYITDRIMNRASQLFEQTISKKNTMFDAVVAATAEELQAEAIFSFDGWYPKLGFTLAENFVEDNR